MGKHLWVIGGSICVGLGILGILLPVLPTTPFLLLAAFCYSRGSERFYQWLLYRSLFGGYIRNYREGRGIPLKQKLVTIVILWLTIGFTITMVAAHWWLEALMIVVASGVTIHLARVKTFKQLPASSMDHSNAIKAVETPRSYPME